MDTLESFSNQISFSADVNQYLTFTFGQEEYGVEIIRVQEVRGFAPITPIPNAPSYVKGVMNLRGTIVPVVDLRAKFGREKVDYDRFNVIIVFNMGAQVRGLLVDAVSDVLSIRKSDIQFPPDFGDSASARFISGLAKAGDKVVLLLDIDQVLGCEEHALPANLS